MAGNIYFSEATAVALQNDNGGSTANGVGVVVPLEEEEIKRIWDHVPWKEELDMYSAVFEEIPPGTNRDLRNAAFHLLWYGRELELDREPMTTDKL